MAHARHSFAPARLVTCKRCAVSRSVVFAGLFVVSLLCQTAFVFAPFASVQAHRPGFAAHRSKQKRAGGGSIPRHSASQPSKVVDPSLRPVILCPAQFGTQDDYKDLEQDLRARGFALYVAPLTRFDWLKIVPSTLTVEFFTASLRPSRTLGFFYEALDEAFATVEADYGNQVPVAVLGHSIGGWVARSYIAEVLGENAGKRVCSLVTLGTPHNPPPEDSPVAALDQTRGLLNYINAKFPCGWPLHPSTVTCVAGNGTRTPESLDALLDDALEKVWDSEAGRSPLLENVVALTSYFPLSGEGFGTDGDGLIPVHTALMQGCKTVCLEDCNHAGFVPTPGQSLRLPDSYKWYGSASLIDEWSEHL